MKYRLLQAVNILALSALAFLKVNDSSISWWYFVAVLFVYSLVLFGGCALIQWQFFMPVVCKVPTEGKVVYLTFDDGPHPELTPLILEVLRNHNIKAAFFCIGKNLSGNEALVAEMNQHGHVIANHSFEHNFWFDMLPAEKMLQQMQQTDSVVEAITGQKNKLFRPPYGVMNPNLTKAIKQGGYTPVGWSIRSMDTVAQSKDQLIQKVVWNLKPGAIILLHDTISLTAESLDEMIQKIKEKGYSFGDCSQNLFTQV